MECRNDRGQYDCARPVADEWRRGNQQHIPGRRRSTRPARWKRNGTWCRQSAPNHYLQQNFADHLARLEIRIVFRVMATLNKTNVPVMMQADDITLEP